MRFSATKTLTRPNFADLNPALALFHSGPTSQIGSGNGGNPNLQPIKSTNYDLSLEYYFTKTNQITVTLFDRELNGYVQSFFQAGGRERQYCNSTILPAHKIRVMAG